MASRDPIDGMWRCDVCDGYLWRRTCADVRCLGHVTGGCMPETRDREQAFAFTHRWAAHLKALRSAAPA